MAKSDEKAIADMIDADSKGNSRIAKELSKVFNERQTSYGTPEDNFSRVADLWNAYIPSANVTALDVAHMMILFKVARSMNPVGNKEDNYIDIAGYAECGLDIMLGKKRKVMICL
jgi:hypothetical protein